MGAKEKNTTSDETLEVERQREPPEAIVRGPHQYRGEQCTFLIYG